MGQLKVLKWPVMGEERADKSRYRFNGEKEEAICQWQLESRWSH